MRGFAKVGAATPVLHLGDPASNLREHLACVGQAVAEGVAILVFPELSLTGYSCGDLFFRGDLLAEARKALSGLAAATAARPIACVAGLPVEIGSGLYNVAAVLAGGAVRGLVPKTYLPTYGEYYEHRQFTSARHLPPSAEWGADAVPVGTDLVFSFAGCRFAVELCEDLWAAVPPSSRLAGCGLDLVVNLSASTDFLGKSARRRERVVHQSAVLGCAYAMACAGTGESGADAVFGGQSLVAAGGGLLDESPLFADGPRLTTGVFDREALAYRRRSFTSLSEEPVPDGVRVIGLGDAAPEPPLPPEVSPAPFLDEYGEPGWVEKLLDIQSVALARRMRASRSEKLVIGVSGGADSALALLGAARALARSGRPAGNLLGIVMPGPGSTEATQSRAVGLVRAVGATPRVIDISPACRLHLQDIGHPADVHDLAFENVQARERTQILMDLANMEGALVVGTGDLSEIALGWNTYNGDHMSMYQINASVPKTMVLAALDGFAETAAEPLKGVLRAIARAPITPELVPGAAANDSEARLGPYELHDFCLYHCLANGAGGEKLTVLAEIAFRGRYEPAVVRATVATFLRRFKAAQYKRNCVPDGPKITLSLSPRADWRMPSD